MVSPALFIPLVEQYGLMPELTTRTLSLAIAGGRKLIERHPGFTIAVNVSGTLLTDLTLPERIESILRKQGVAPESLIVEVTESVAMSDVQRAMDILVRLRIKGVGAAIEISVRGFLHCRPLTTSLQRIEDRSNLRRGLLQGRRHDENRGSFDRVGQAFRMKVVAEGIDSPETLAMLRQLGCDVGQGYLFSSAFGI